MSKKFFRYVVYFLLAYVSFLFWTLPADQAFVFARKRAAIPVQVDTQDLTGTWHSGRAVRCVIGDVVVQDLVWRLRLLPLLTGRVSSDVKCKISGGKFQGRLSGNRNQLTASGIQLAFPSSLLEQFFPKIYAVPLGGEITGSIDAVKVVDGVIVEARGDIMWQGAATKTPPIVKLGDIRAVGVTDEEGVKIHFADGGGPLDVNGDLWLTRQGGFQFTGSFAVRDKTQKNLNDALSLLGRPGADGRVTLSFDGVMPRIVF
ncbi:type II secretion system protein N [Thermodesulfobacteriota bacterium]